MHARKNLCSLYCDSVSLRSVLISFRCFLCLLVERAETSKYKVQGGDGSSSSLAPLLVWGLVDDGCLLLWSCAVCGGMRGKAAAKIDCRVIDHCRKNSSRVADRASQGLHEVLLSHCVVLWALRVTLSRNYLDSQPINRARGSMVTNAVCPFRKIG